MTRLFLLFLIFTSTNLLAKEESVICPMIYYKSVKKVVEASGDYDKFKHCAVSCLLTLKCPAVDVKELIDMVGPGNAEMADLRADFDGVDLVVKNKVKTNQACLNGCHKLYPENSCQ